ncbi:hypothetical protein ACFV85_14975 [Streptomyces niveus]|uniref:hypothetical protein n=1 Tax=Streptomyces niveus TaxID=193462 RepID=UPI00365A0BC9
MQQGPSDEPKPAYRVRWMAADGLATIDAIEAPRVTEGCLILKTTPSQVLWVALGTILGPIQIDGI